MILFLKKVGYTLNFRTDINGLRAIAVIAVVLFHFAPLLVPGGFAGVDIFFVISGFLMTGIIFRGFNNNSFFLFKFYVSRANRIIPVLTVLSLVLLILGWFNLSPIDYETLAKDIISSLGFYSNMSYWHQSGYFDAASYEKWLLHTWSLSVEWQFYIIYPIVLLFLKKFLSTNQIKWFIWIGIIISFSISIYATNKWPTAAYYLLPSRGWEMLIGGAAYLYPINLNDKNKKWLEGFGLLLILLSYTLISKENAWPGYLAFFPVLGTYLVISANRQTSIFTNNLIFQKLGKWSYSIYIWHWPIVVYSYYMPIKNWVFIGIPLSIFLGWLSFNFIESYKFPSFNKWKQFIFVKPVLFAIAAGVAATSIYLSEGAAAQRFTNKDNTLVKELSSKIVMAHRGNGYCFYSLHDKTLKVDAALGQNCFLGSTASINEVDTLLFGDSFAGHNDPFWNEIFIKLDKTYQSVSTNWCTPSFTKNFTGPKSHNSYQQCLLNRDFLKKSISENKYKNIIFASSWNAVLHKGFIDDFLEVVSEATKQGIKVFVVATPTSYIRNPIQLLQRSIYLHKPFDLSRYEREYQSNNYVNDLLSKKLKKYPNVYFIDRKMMFEKNNTFLFKTLDIPYSIDGKHISLIGATNAANYFINSPNYIDISKGLY